MGRLLSAAVLCAALLMPAQGMRAQAQPVFFSMLFPQLVPPQWREATAGEAVFL